MKELIAKQLIKLNQDFYQKIAADFDVTRQFAWTGWKELLQNSNFIKKLNCQNLKVVDLGCGNGRFYDFLQTNFDNHLQYYGLDFDSSLLKIAKRNYENANFECSNLLTENWQNLVHQKLDYADLIVVFGVMHHIPSIVLREQFFSKISQICEPKSLVIFTIWQFLDFASTQKSIVKSGEYLSKFNIDPAELDLGDYILDWKRGATAYRYAHYYSIQEITDLMENSGFKILNSYAADGREKQVNKYFLCQKV